MSQCYDVPNENAIDEHMQSEEAGLSWHVHRRCPLTRHDFSNLVRLVRGMNPGQWRQPVLQAQVDYAHMVQWVPTPNHPLPLHSALVVVLLETLDNDAPSTPFQLETFSAASRLVLIVRTDTFVVIEGRLDMRIQDILRDGGRLQDLH
jgi:hypothetical protein